MDLSKYLRMLRKRWWLIALVAVVGTTTATYFTFRQPLVYSSTVTLLLNPASRPGSLVVASPVYLTQQLADTFSHYLRTHTFAEMVIEREQLAISAEQLVGSVTTQLIEGTQFFQITAQGNSPEQAQLLADAIARNFIEANREQQRNEVAARRAAGDVGNVQALLAEKLERERQYYEGQVAGLREEINRIQQQPPSTTRDELLGQVQEQLSGYEERLVGIMSDQIDLTPPIDEAQLNSVTIVEAADLPLTPINAPGPRNVIYALMASLVLGIGLAFGLEYVDYTVKGPEDLEYLVGHAPLGVVGVFVGGAGRGANNGALAQVEQDVVLLREPRSPAAEAYRSIRTNLRFSGVGGKLRSLVVTSAVPGEGKSQTSSNLAVAFAQSGRRVILVDADLRRPSIARRFGLANHYGLSDLLVDEEGTKPEVIAAYLQPGPVAGLQILTSGAIPPNPAELLSADWAPAICDALEAQADLVIWDTPPVLTVTDAVIMAGRAGATLQVIRAGRTRRDLVLRTRAELERVGAHVLAPMLNQVKTVDVGYYSGYYYSGYQTTADRQKTPKQDPSTGATPHRERTIAPAANGAGGGNGFSSGHAGVAQSEMASRQVRGPMRRPFGRTS
jgi:non-specific protein-tyrosine kinase